MTTRPGDNPFASRRVDDLDYRFPGGSVDCLLAELSRQDHRGAVVGPHGSGKTTLLDELQGKIQGTVVRIDLRAEVERPLTQALARLSRPIGREHAVLLDGAEQLGWWSWRVFRHRVRQAGTLVITSHRPGRLPTVHECRTDPGLLVELVRELDPATATFVDLEALFDRHRGNLRLCFRELYELQSGMESSAQR
jgi:hypothetical protein